MHPEEAEVFLLVQLITVINESEVEVGAGIGVGTGIMRNSRTPDKALHLGSPPDPTPLVPSAAKPKVAIDDNSRVISLLMMRIMMSMNIMRGTILGMVLRMSMRMRM